MVKYTREEVSIFEEKSKNSKVTLVVPKNTKISALDMEDDWDKVSYTYKWKGRLFRK
ncbi:hypothetical protein SAMN04487886_12342 [Clostridium sp. DSM 8431]|uniref:hypothetical protein n=1 Tax=Clostridium sp. DSM 8431 TaxID=1761781 RepID=UPI0008E56AA5|nr:hypothetical protein [Clostridium sp. DSM 8431]SFU86173.1 hypothetical protein SAMN04487886_12342 [Clostridium sp. DSM 8431]